MAELLFCGLIKFRCVDTTHMLTHLAASRRNTWPRGYTTASAHPVSIALDFGSSGTWAPALSAEAQVTQGPSNCWKALDFWPPQAQFTPQVWPQLVPPCTPFGPEHLSPAPDRAPKIGIIDLSYDKGQAPTPPYVEVQNTFKRSS